MDGESDFMKKIDSVKSSEKEAEAIIKAAEQKASLLLQETRNTISSMKLKNAESIVEFKNAEINSKKNEIESKVGSLVKKEQEKVVKITKLCIDKKQAVSLVDWFLNSV